MLPSKHLKVATLGLSLVTLAPCFSLAELPAFDRDCFALNAKECGILRLLLFCRGEIVSRDRLPAELWRYHANPTSRTVHNFIAELRKKLGAESDYV